MTDGAAANAPTRLIVLGGFLGAGKTTLLLRLADAYRAAGARVGIIANDQGADLVDTARFRAEGLAAAEVTGGCFCCRFDDFVARADELLARHQPQVLLAEPVGSCTDLIATVINPLRRDQPHRFEIAPFTVLVDPVRALDLLTGRRSAKLSEKVTYIFRMQQQEAEAIAISKLDLLSAQERTDVLSLLGERFPGVPLIGVSARSGEGVAALQAWLAGTAGPRPAPVVDYDAYADGEAALGWLNASATVRAAAAFDLDGAARDLMQAIAAQCRAGQLQVVHAKVLLRGPHRVAVVSLLDSGGDPQPAQLAGEQSPAAALLVNLRVEAKPERVRAVLNAAVSGWQDTLGLAADGLSLAAFSPPRPVPTHHIPSLS